MRVTIKSKLAGAFGLVLAMSAIAGGVSYTKLSELADTQQDLARRGSRIGLVSDLQNILGATARSEKNVIIESDPKKLEALVEELNQRRASLLKKKTELEASASAEGRQVMEAASGQLDRYNRIQDETIRNAQLNSNYRALLLWQSETSAIIPRVNAAKEALTSELTKPEASAEQLRRRSWSAGPRRAGFARRACSSRRSAPAPWPS